MSGKNIIFNIPKLALLTASLPLISFIFCISISIIFNFNESTSTHCKVKNYLPSISASIGNFSPQKYVWRISIALHSSPRFFISYLYYKLHHRNFYAHIFNLIEISSLIGLSFVSSIEDFPTHAKFFTLFILASLIHMYILLRKNLIYRRQIRYYCALCNFITGFTSVYLYFRHNWYCEPGVYSLFALSEYLVVISNIIFHLQVYYDLKKIRAIIIENIKLKDYYPLDETHLI